MNAQLTAELDNAQQCLLETYNMALEFGDEESQNHNVYLTCFSKLLTIKENARRMDQAMDTAREHCTTENIEKEFQNSLATIMSKKYDFKNSPSYIGFEQELLNILAAKEESEEATTSNATRIESEDFIMESNVNVFDPLTKQRMQNPVRNTLCNHHYEKSSILEAIQITNRLRCPVAGCGNKAFVKKNHLLDDNIFKIRLQKMQEKEN